MSQLQPDYWSTPPFSVAPAEVARVLGVGVRQARAFIDEGRVYSFRVGRRVLVPKAALRKLLEGSEAAEVAPELASRTALRLG